MEEITFPCNKAGLTPVRPAREIMSLQNITGIHSTVSVSLKPPVSFRNVLDFSVSCNGAQVVRRLSDWLQLRGCRPNLMQDNSFICSAWPQLHNRVFTRCMEEITFPCNKAGLTPVRPARENVSLQNITGIHSTVSVSLKLPVSFRHVLDFSASCNGAQVVRLLSDWLQLRGCRLNLMQDNSFICSAWPQLHNRVFTRCMEEITFPCNKADLTPVRPAREIMSLQNITGIHSTVSVSLKPPVSFRNVFDFSASCNGAQVVQRLSGWLQLQGSKEVGTDFSGANSRRSEYGYFIRFIQKTVLDSNICFQVIFE
ncbi:uncharacterized protein OCT59_024091 [Rhizophagus irregularis]|uniref:uncharacterized protein n=1 Tax=Rhizophagus irregularis TaxID=588596 RepID=UPI00332602DD|nr:hypothetical protein OCT59_024091 [Rhizophagus irregularis]